MALQLKTILAIIAAILKLIADGIPESQAISLASQKFGVSEKLLRKYF